METKTQTLQSKPGNAYSQRREWFVVYSKPHKEETAKFHLELKGIRVFFPRLLLPEGQRRRKRPVAMFPNYLFVHICLCDEAPYVIWAPGVNRIVSFNGTPAPLDDDIILFLMQRGDPEGIIRVWPGLRAGQRVQIAAGPFEGLVGILEAPPDAKGRVRILIRLLSRQVQVRVPVELVKSELA